MKKPLAGRMRERDRAYAAQGESAKAVALKRKAAPIPKKPPASALKVGGRIGKGVALAIAAKTIYSEAIAKPTKKKP